MALEKEMKPGMIEPTKRVCNKDTDPSAQRPLKGIENENGTVRKKRSKEQAYELV
jgi:hypothetical protein